MTQAYKLVEEIKGRQSDTLLETGSGLSYQSSCNKVSSCASTTSNAAKMKALAEAAVREGTELKKGIAAIEQAMEEEDTGNKIEIAGIPNTKGGE